MKFANGNDYLHNILGPEAYVQVCNQYDLNPNERIDIVEALRMHDNFKAKFHGPEKRSIPVDIAKSRNIKIVQEQYGRYQPQTNL